MCDRRHYPASKETVIEEVAECEGARGVDIDGMVRV
jgi:hypothetical protein